MVRNFLESDEFLMARDYRDQVGIMCRVLRDEMDNSFSYEKIGCFFEPNKSPSAILQQEKKYKEGSKQNGRPPLLSDEEIETLKILIQERIEDEGYPSYEDISDIIVDNFNKFIALPSIRTIIKRLEEFKVVKAAPIESGRYYCQLDDIKKFYDDLQVLLEEVPIGWLFNLDETGQQDFVDSRDTFVIVPSSRSLEANIRYGVDRNGKRCTILHCIKSDGKFLKPLIVLPRKTIDTEVFNEISPEDVMIAEARTGFIDTRIFCKWFDEIFLAKIARTREKKPIILEKRFS